MTKGPRPRPVLERFWDHVTPSRPDECWEWRGAREPSGYGFLHSGRDGKRWEKAHRISWELQSGAVPAGLLVCHRCDNPPCVNPAHLFIGTKADNNRDRSRKGRGRESRPGNRGERSPVAKLSRDDVLAIRAAVAAGETQQRVANRFGVNQPHISRIVLRQSRRYD